MQAKQQVETGSFEPYAATVNIFNQNLASGGPPSLSVANQVPQARSLSTTLASHKSQQYDTIILKLNNVQSEVGQFKHVRNPTAQSKKQKMEDTID